MASEPPMKKIRPENTSILEAVQTCCKYIIDLKQIFNQRFSALENRVCSITSNYNKILQRIDVLESLVKKSINTDKRKHQCCEDVLKKMTNIENMLKSNNIGIYKREISDPSSDSWNSPVVLVRNNKPAQVSANVALDSSVQVITLNSENDYPDGSWLGDENNPEARVRCCITPGNLVHINTFCQSPEKMALTLLDYLFPREILAISNLSGKGKHGKKQLDPLMIYGIRCHLLQKFNINDRDWYRIKQNIDSKCRTAWRKKVRGLPLGGFKNSPSDVSSHLHYKMEEKADEIIEEDGVEPIETQLIHTSEGDLKVVHATPEQLARLRRIQHVQIVVPILQEESQLVETEESEVATIYRVLQENVHTEGSEVSEEAIEDSSH